MSASGPHVLILGGGLAGSAAAIELARAGRTVTLLERDREPKHKVCGEFLSAEATHLLHHLGVSPTQLGALPIQAVRLCSKRALTEAPLPFPALSLTRKRLDAALLTAAQDAGAKVLRGASVKSLHHASHGWQATTTDGRVFPAGEAILATGKHDLRGFTRPPGVQRDLLGLKLYLRLASTQHAALAGHVELLLHPEGYTGLQPVEDGLANLCALVRRSTLTRFGTDGQRLLDSLRQSSRHADARLATAEALDHKPLAIAPIPYGFVRKHALHDHLWSIGDQAAVIPSFTGDGMSIALYTGVLAAQSILRGETARLFQLRLHSQLRAQVARATAISRALVHPFTSGAVSSLVHLWPGALCWTAATTRIPARAMHTLSLAT